jgi:hypothetical protein
MTMFPRRRRSRPAPRTQRRRRQAPVARRPRRGWQQHKPQPRGTHGLRNQSRNIGRYVRRRARRRSWIFGVLTLGVAATAFTLVTIGSLSQLAAWEFGLAAEGMAFGTAWLLGEGKDGSPSPAKKAAKAVKSRAAVCGAPTADKSSCKNRGNCPHHKAGGKATNTAGSSTTAAKSKTKKPAPRSRPRKQPANAKAAP